MNNKITLAKIMPCGAQLCAMKRNSIIEIWCYDDYGDWCGGQFTVTKNETARKTLLTLAKKMIVNDNYQFEWRLKRMVETSH
jgi:hypothetical protein